MTSPSPPTFDHGATSVATKTICGPGTARVQEAFTVRGCRGYVPAGRRVPQVHTITEYQLELTVPEHFQATSGLLVPVFIYGLP